jgi:signal transduction histidine kinase
LDSILALLGEEICRPIRALGSTLQKELECGPSLAAAGGEARIHAMIHLCQDIAGLTKAYRDYIERILDEGPSRLESAMLSEFVDEMDADHGPVAKARGIEWRCLLVGLDANVTTDRACCRQVLDALLDNAFQYTGRGGRIEVKSYRDEAAWVVTIADTGLGIPSESLERAFEPFHRCHMAERPDIPGYGLGLSLARALARRLGGSVELASRVGQGTTVTLRLPLNAAPRRLSNPR